MFLESKGNSEKYWYSITHIDRMKKNIFTFQFQISIQYMFWGARAKPLTQDPAKSYINPAGFVHRDLVDDH